MKRHQLTAVLILILTGVIIFVSGKSFVDMHQLAPLYPSDGVTEVKMLSDYFPGLKDTSGDTEVYIFEGEKPGGAIFVLGGTHPNEPSGYLSAILMVENLKVSQGKVIVVPRGNRSAFTHNDPQEGQPQEFTITTPNGERWFRFGSRATNPIDQWPDPDIYIHPSGQRLSGNETRNLNRAYPGLQNGSLTEKVAYGIVQLIKQEEVDIAVDLHEASPEYPVINAIVAHEKANELAAMSMMQLQFEGIEFALELSPPNFHGLSHREWGDFTDTMAILMESANPIQGRFRGKTTKEMILTGQDDCYVKAAELDRLYVSFDDNGHPIEERVGRHLSGIQILISTMADFNPDKKIVFENIPGYTEIMEAGIGAYLKTPNI